jgi:GNAT superfamily N-acetyltransferase
VRSLLLEYGRLRTFDAALGDYDRELADLPGGYAPPEGRLLLARLDDHAAGCIAYQRIAPGVCEMKRLFVSRAFTGHRIGARLIERLLEDARRAGYSTMRLDTHPFMTHAQALYERFGFGEIAAYNDNPTPGIRFFELVL